MVIDLPSSSQIVARGNQNPVTQVVNQRLETLLTALKALNIHSGETLTALVKAVHPVDDALRARLIQQATPPSAAAATSANRNATAANPETLKLLQAADLKLAEIEVRGKTLLTFTDQPLRPNQTLTLQVQHQQLVILADKSSAPAYQTHLSTALAATGEHSASLSQPLLNNAQLHTLQQALRAQLPMQVEAQHSSSAAVISHSLQLAQLLTQLLRQPGGEALQQQIPRSVQESLQQLAAHLRSPQQLAQPPALKQAIAGSGLQLEHQLHQGLTGQLAARLPLLPQTDLKAALLQALQQLSTYARPIPATANPAAAQPGAAAAGINVPIPVSTPAQAGAVSPPASALPLIAALQQLLQGSSLQRKAAVDKLSADKLLQTTRHQVQQALDKLSYLQLQTLQKQLQHHARPHLDGVNTLHLQLEIPVNWGAGAHSVALSIDEDWVTDYANETDERKEKVQQWQVRLTFELPGAGSLHAHLTVVREQLSASFWAEQADTFAKTRAALQSLRQQLEQDGCEVRQLECFHGRPVTEEPMRLNYSLIDIQT